MNTYSTSQSRHTIVLKIGCVYLKQKVNPLAKLILHLEAKVTNAH